MTDIITEDPSAKIVLRFRARIENGVIIPEEAITLPANQIYLVTVELEPQTEPEQEIDALAQIASMAQPLGPIDLARNFDA